MDDLYKTIAKRLRKRASRKTDLVRSVRVRKADVALTFDVALAIALRYEKRKPLQLSLTVHGGQLEIIARLSNRSSETPLFQGLLSDPACFKKASTQLARLGIVCDLEAD